MCNKLYLVVPSNLKQPSNVIRLAKSIDYNNNIFLFFINQNSELFLKDIYSFKKCHVKEFRTNCIIPISKARNIVLNYLYSTNSFQVDNSIIMFVDDDAWFPSQTLDMLLKEPITARCLRTIDPEKNKSFNGLSYQEGLVRGWHIIHDIPSICLVAPFDFVYKGRYLFNEKLGLGCEVSQGEESLFIYNLCKDGLKIHYNGNYIYHPYKTIKNPINNYGMSYFWALGVSRISFMFFWPCLKYILKYTIALLLIVKNKVYFEIFKNVWKGFFDGIIDSKKVLLNNE